MAGVAGVAFHSPDVHRGISEPRAGVYSVGIRVFDVQPRSAIDHGPGSGGFGIAAETVGKEGREGQDGAGGQQCTTRKVAFEVSLAA